VRQLLMAGLGAAGLLLVNLPASGQLSDDTSTFRGEVAATCSFEGLADSYLMTYYTGSNQLGGQGDFDVISNVSNLRIEVGSVVVNSEPAPFEGKAINATGKLRQSIDGRWIEKVTSSKSFPGDVVVDISEGSRFRLSAYNWTQDRNGSLMYIPPGNYSYTITITCLL